jgi:hypothetical protein
MKKALLVALLGIAALVALACSGGEDENLTPPSQATPTEQLRLTVALEVQSSVSVGEAVPLTLKLRNEGESLASVYLGGNVPYDFVVSKPNGTEVWRWLASQVIQPLLELKTLDGGEELKFEGEWDQRNNEGQPVSPGAYLVRGVLKGETPEGQRLELKTEPRELVITP